MTKKKDPSEYKTRGRPRKTHERIRLRACSPFLSAAKGEPRPDIEPALQVLESVQLVQSQPGKDHAVRLLADVPVYLSGVRTALTEDQIQATRRIQEILAEFKVKPFADNSERSIRSDWRHWIAFCVQHDKVAMPIDVRDLMTFVDALIKANYRRATLEHLFFTLNWASKVWHCQSPTDNLIFDYYWRDRCRTRLIKRQHQARGLTINTIEMLEDATSDADPRALRDLAFVSVAYDLMARASEMVAIQWDAILSRPDGSGEYTIDRSKSDQEGKGADMFLTADTMAKLRAWGSHRFAENPYAFHALPRYEGQQLVRTRPLAVREVSRIFARVSERAGIDGTLSGHSARVGGAQDMTFAEMSLASIMQTGRWKSSEMPARYAAKEDAARAGKKRAAAINKLRKDKND